MSNDTPPVCDVCGAPATNWVQDSISQDNWAAGCVEHRPVGRPRFGCDHHPTEPEVYKSMVPLGRDEWERR